MSEARGLQIGPSLALREKRLLTLLAGRSEGDPALASVVRDAQLLGSLELAGFTATWADVRSATPPAEVVALRKAQGLLPLAAPLTRQCLLDWHAVLTGTQSGYRQSDREREGGPPPAPAPFIEGRLGLLEDWLAAESAAELHAAQKGALVLARIVEILPFDDANGRIARLAASHVMVRTGARPPILVKGDRPRLEASLQSAFQLDTEPLLRLLEEASARCLDVMIQALAAPT